jgi:uncharacterized protein YdaU (DUF1376 family)
MEPMKKPTTYFPFFGNDFFEAIAGYSDGVGLGYLRALWHYWNHTACEGLPDDEEYLRRICACDRADWERTRGILFDNRYHFKLENGLWHQERCRAEFRRSQEICAQRSKLGAAAARRRWANA